MVTGQYYLPLAFFCVNHQMVNEELRFGDRDIVPEDVCPCLMGQPMETNVKRVNETANILVTAS